MSPTEHTIFEEWRPVVGFDRYEVSDQGRVRNAKTLAVIKLQSGGRAKNYLRAQLTMWESGKCVKRRNAYVHALVLESFVGPLPAGMVRCHKNDIGTDNRLDNLYYGTPEDNQNDKHVNTLELDTMSEAPF